MKSPPTPTPEGRAGDLFLSQASTAPPGVSFLYLATACFPPFYFRFHPGNPLCLDGRTAFTPNGEGEKLALDGGVMSMSFRHRLLGFTPQLCHLTTWGEALEFSCASVSSCVTEGK